MDALWCRGGACASTLWIREKQQTMGPMVFAKPDIWEQPALMMAQNYLCSLNSLAVGLPHPTGG
jgi:hypothetical protein